MRYIHVICLLCFLLFKEQLNAQANVIQGKTSSAQVNAAAAAAPPSQPAPPCPPFLEPQIPEIDFQPNKSFYCIGDNVAIQYMNPQMHGIVDMSWEYLGVPFTQLLNTTSTTFNISNLMQGGPIQFMGTISTVQVGDCSFSMTFKIDLTLDLVANAGPDIFVSTNFPSGTIGGYPAGMGGTPGYTYLWTPNSTINNATVSNPVVNPSATTVYQLVVTDQNSCVSQSDAVTVYNISNLSNPNQTYYAVLKEKLDGSFYNTVPYSGSQTLFFMFDEEYYKPGTSNNLNYSIVDNNNTAITTTPALVKKIGDNRFALNITTTSPVLTTGAYYKLVVKNEKNEVWQTRFKVN